jgi:hypothetical protein
MHPTSNEEGITRLWRREKNKKSGTARRRKSKYGPSTGRSWKTPWPSERVRDR